jgi:hypothetical protein
LALVLGLAAAGVPQLRALLASPANLGNSSSSPSTRTATHQDNRQSNPETNQTTQGSPSDLRSESQVATPDTASSNSPDRSSPEEVHGQSVDARASVPTPAVSRHAESTAMAAGPSQPAIAAGSGDAQTGNSQTAGASGAPAAGGFRAGAQPAAQANADDPRRWSSERQAVAQEHIPVALRGYVQRYFLAIHTQAQ